jgi:hypothetical protein
MSGQWFNTIGLVLDIIGVCILFKFGWPQPDLDKSIKAAWDDKHPGVAIYLRKRRLYKTMSVIGLVCLVGGFLLQLRAGWM